MMIKRYYSNDGPLLKLDSNQYRALEIFNEKCKAGLYKFEAVPCLCGNAEGQLIARRDRYALPINTYLCKSCGMMWTNPRMTQESLERFYQEDYRLIYVGDSSAPDDFFYDQVKRGNSILEYVNRFVPNENLSRVFDIGCGAGGVLVPFSRSGWEAFGCDINQEYLDRGLEEGLNLIYGEGSDLMTEAPADLIILSHVLEHMASPILFIKQVSSLLKDNGYLYIELPGIFCIHRTYGDLLLFLQNAHLYHFTLTSLRSLMSKLGYQYVIGDEWLRAIFVRSDSKFVEKQSFGNQYRRVMFYLWYIEIRRWFIESNIWKNHLL